MLEVICMSKNRPFQLKEYLRTAKHYLWGEKQISVIWACDPEYEDRYSQLIEHHKDVRWVRETNFPQDMAWLLETAQRNGRYVMFGVDDALFYDYVDIDAACKLLRTKWAPFGLHLKMSPGLSICHSAGGVPQREPPLIPHDERFYLFNRRLGTYDWNYPWEVIATMYRRGDVIDLVRYARSLGHRLETPNGFEGQIAHLFGTNHPGVQRFSDCMACSAKPVVSVVSVNCVQQDRTPVYPCEHSEPGALNRLFDEGVQFDDEFYRQQRFRSVHVGAFRLKQPC